jgi:predicted exporter
MAVLLAAVLVGLAVVGSRVTFDGDLTRLDGSSEAVRSADRRFADAWITSGSEPAMLVVERDDQQAAIEAARRAGEELVRRIGPEGVQVTPRIWPSPERRAENLARWTAFWAGGRAERVRELLTASGTRYSFADDAFQPFLASIGAAPAAAAPSDAFLDRLRDRFIVRAGDRWQAVSLFPERAEFRAAAREIAAADGDAFVVSRAELTETLSASVADDMMRVAAVALALVVTAVVLLVGSLRVAAIVLVPSIVGCLAAAATSVLRGVPLSVADLVAGIVVVGLNIDYGTFMADTGGPGEHSPTKGVTLCFATTVAGTASLLFASHPALATIGATLTAGISTGFLVAVGCVPALARLSKRPGKEARS